MKRKYTAIILAILIVASIPITAYAATPRSLSIQPALQFKEMTATCSVTIAAEQTDSIKAVITLWKGSKSIATWDASGTYCIFFKNSATVTSKGEYTLTVDVEINGESKPQVSITATCE